LCRCAWRPTLRQWPLACRRNSVFPRDRVDMNLYCCFQICWLHSIAHGDGGALVARGKYYPGSIMGEWRLSLFHCIITGSGRPYLGRAWGQYSTWPTPTVEWMPILTRRVGRTGACSLPRTNVFEADILKKRVLLFLWTWKDWPSKQFFLNIYYLNPLQIVSPLRSIAVVNALPLPLN